MLCALFLAGGAQANHPKFEALNFSTRLEVPEPIVRRHGMQPWDYEGLDQQPVSTTEFEILGSESYALFTKYFMYYEQQRIIQNLKVAVSEPGTRKHEQYRKDLRAFEDSQSYQKLTHPVTGETIYTADWFEVFEDFTDADFPDNRVIGLSCRASSRAKREVGRGNIKCEPFATFFSCGMPPPYDFNGQHYPSGCDPDDYLVIVEFVIKAGSYTNLLPYENEIHDTVYNQDILFVTGVATCDFNLNWTCTIRASELTIVPSQ